MLILYATQTGNAEYYAQELCRSLRGANIQSIDQYNYIDLPQESMVFFIVSTTGDGEMPQSMKSFWNFLAIKDLPKDSLKAVRFSVFGLGDSSYSKFNYAGRKLRSRILQLSGNEFIKSNFGDEMHPCGIDTEFLVWHSQVISVLKLQASSELQLQVQHIQEEQDLQAQNNDIYIGRQRLSKEGHSKATYKFDFYSKLHYKCGDILLLKPQNDEQIVKKVISLLGYNNLDKQTLKINFKNKCQKQMIIPQKISIQNLLTYFLDLTSPPTRYFIRILSKFAQLEIHKQKLSEMSAQTAEGQEEYYNYVYREKRNVFEVLFDFQPCQLPLEYLIDSLSLIREREYSISSFINEDNIISITVALVHYKSPKNREIWGFTSNYLNQLKENTKVNIRIKQSTLKFPENLNSPIIMIGPGTGIAPFISFIQMRAKQWIKKEGKPEDTVLFFGSCFKESEFYYEDLLEKQSMHLKLFTAFSRDQENKIYVQHRIKEQRELLIKIISQNVGSIIIMVCGTSKKMPQQVEQSIREIIGEEIMNRLKLNGQYQVECW